jgi:hypothetical protein
MIRRLLAASVGLAVVTLGFSSAGYAADPCAAQVREAKAALASAPSGEQEGQASGSSLVDSLVREAEAACKQGDMTLASRKAQEALDVLKSAPATEREGVGARLAPSATAPGRTRPSDFGHYQPSPSVSHDPMFIGPTGKTETGQLGLSAWIAPSTPVGNELAGGWRRQSGTPAIGFTFTWGGPSRRPEPQAP